mmetsp:Transcript_29363/g.51438  ORF Transcript_29363/g.51438 Transcript_29363/m.51438 type:complete len:421 (-) Transcript_29363:126-1388(-)
MPLDAWHLGWPAEAFHRPGQEDFAFGANAADPFHGHDIRIFSTTPPPGSDPQLWARGGSTSKGQLPHGTIGSPLRGHDVPEQQWIRRALEFLDRPLPSMQPTSCSAPAAALPGDGFLQRPVGDPSAWPQGHPGSNNSIQSVGHNYFYSDIGGKAEVQESETQCDNGDCRTIEHRVLPHAHSGPGIHGGSDHQASRADLLAGVRRPPRLRMPWDALDDMAHQAFSTVGHLLNRRMMHLPDAGHWQMPHGAGLTRNQSHEFMYSENNGNRGYSETVTRCRDGHCETTKRVVEPLAAQAAGATGPGAGGAELGHDFMPSSKPATLRSSCGQSSPEVSQRQAENAEESSANAPKVHSSSGSALEEASNDAAARAQTHPSPATTGGMGAASAENATPVEEAMAMLQKPALPDNVESPDEPAVKEG